MKTEKELIELKSEIEESKTTISELTGQKTALLTQFKNDWRCKSLKEAKQLLTQLEKDDRIFDRKIKAETERLEDIMEDEEN